MSKIVYLNKEAREKIAEGINLLADAVASTLGPSGRTVIIKNADEDEEITKDGVTVANSLSDKDPVKNLGMQMIKKVSSKTETDNGDGTTSATVACREMIKI